MHPSAKQPVYAAFIGCPLSTNTRVPGWIDIPSGRLTRSVLLFPCPSTSSAATTTIPESTRPSLDVVQVCLPSRDVSQDLLQDENESNGCSPTTGAKAGDLGSGDFAVASGAAGEPCVAFAKRWVPAGRKKNSPALFSMRA